MSQEFENGLEIAPRRVLEDPEPDCLLRPADVSTSPYLDEAMAWVTAEEVQPTDPLANQFDHAAWIDETAMETIGGAAATGIASDVAGHPLVEETSYEDLEVLYVRAPGLLHADVQLLTAAALAERVPATVPPLPPASPRQQGQSQNPLFVLAALGLVALIIGVFTAGGWWTERQGDEQDVAFGEIGTDTTVSAEAPIGAVASPSTIAPPGAGAPSSAPPTTAASTTEPPAAESQPGAVLGAAMEALRNAGYSGISARFEGEVLVLEGVMPSDELGGGYFSRVDEITSIVSGIDGVREISPRLFLRGDDGRLRSQLRAISESTPVVFPFAGAEITPESAAVLGAVAEAILANPGLRVLVAGHTDVTGSPEDNAQLAAARSGAVIRELVRLGVPITRLQPVAYGELFPDAEGSDEANRRVEFEVAP